MNWLKMLMPLILVNLLKTDYDGKIRDIEKKHLVLLNVANIDAYTAVKIKIPRLVI